MITEVCRVCEGLCCGEIPRLNAEIERLKETLAYPRLTADAPTEQYKAVLHDVDKGLPVNGQDLINALWWRIANQRREINRLNERLRNNSC
jgi:hypothetical protein